MSILKMLAAVCAISLFLPGFALTAEEERVVRNGVIFRYNPRIMYQNYQPIMDYLS